MSSQELLGNVFILLGVLVMAGFIALEVNRWLDLRKSEEQPHGLRNRTIRRSLGAFLLLVVLLLIKYPSADSLSPVQLFFKYMMCLWLCILVFLIAIWDLRSIRVEIRHELAKDWKNTTQALHEFVAEMAAKRATEDSAKSDEKSTEGASGNDTEVQGNLKP